jgi:SAM-dependent methyltransferase
MKEPPRLHRKLWEFCYIDEALYERGLLAPGETGLGFGVGEEPLPALFASYGCSVVATDMDSDGAQAAGWAGSHQHMGNLAAMNSRGLCDPRVFPQLVTRRVVDMNVIPPDLRNFDFTWSACSLEHVGSIALGIQFILNSVACLRPGGVAVHTTEFNLSSNTETLDNGGTVLFRRSDIEELTRLLRQAGHAIDVSFDRGSGPADGYVDVPPYCSSPHLRLALAGFVTTSIGLIITKKSSARLPARTPSLDVPLHKPLEDRLSLAATVPSLELQATYLGDHRALARILDRFDIVIGIGDPAASPTGLLVDGYYDLPLTQIFHDFVRPGMTVADFGANFGYFTLLAAELAGPRGRVYAFEADEQKSRLLKESIKINHFEDRVRTPKFVALSQPAVSAKRLDQVLEAPIHFMRIDAQCSEVLVLDGIPGILSASPEIKIILTLSRALKTSKADPRTFLQKMKKRGFSYSLISDEGKLEAVGNEQTLLGRPASRLFFERL